MHGRAFSPTLTPSSILYVDCIAFVLANRFLATPSACMHAQQRRRPRPAPNLRLARAYLAGLSEVVPWDLGAEGPAVRRGPQQGLLLAHVEFVPRGVHAGLHRSREIRRPDCADVLVCLGAAEGTEGGFIVVESKTKFEKHCEKKAQSRFVEPGLLQRTR